MLLIHLNMMIENEQVEWQFKWTHDICVFVFSSQYDGFP